MKATVVLYSSKTLENGEHPLMLCLRDRANIKYYSLGVSLPAKHWDKDTRKWKMLPAKTDELIKSTELKFSKKINELATDGKTVSLDTLYQLVENPVKRDFTVFQYYDFLIDEFKATDKIGQKQIYGHSLNTLKKFLNDKDVTFEEVDLSFLHRFERYLKRRNLKPASLSIQFRTLRSVLNKAIKEGYSKTYPFKDFKVVKGEPNHRALSEKDMSSLLNHKKINKKNEGYKMLVFSYFTCGMNFTDVCRLTWDNIRDNEIHYTRQKIHYKIVIPIHPKVKEILDHYRPITGKAPAISGLNDNYIFPILNKEIHVTEQQITDRIHKTRTQFNDYLKIIGKVAGLDVPLSSYVLRHTAITNLVRAGVTADAIQALAGHKRLTTTEIYIKEASQQQKTKAVNML